MEERAQSTGVVRWVLIFIGHISVVLGVIGIFIPIWPTTPFLLLGAACYVRSSDRFYHWLITNRWFGSYVKNYREGKGIPKKTKITTILLLWASMIFSIFFIVDVIIVKVILVLITAGVTAHIHHQKISSS